MILHFDKSFTNPVKVRSSGNEDAMAEHYDTLWSLVRTWKGNPRPAFSYDDGGETPATLSYDAFFDLVTKTAADTKPQDIPIAFPCVRTPENLAVLLGTLLGGNDLIMIDESGTPPDGFLLAPVEKGPAPIPGSPCPMSSASSAVFSGA